ncbi:Alpha/Beta hydrolase protein [Lasiosphaeris hirsuta]|uniref:Alpha/Beta hydrolase protein n=1 Tax=Lasiosphaeris hirsuta TaxID=260670 RepID=A0AA40AP38_9PEZI|nr:Alpha/Beta hydrolase protein [Lasiosphaeris hirsuta]
MADNPPPQSPPKVPFHLSLNPTQPTTILLLHGLLSSHLEWAHVTPLLASYHLLIPDLPGHSASSTLPARTIPAMATTMAAFIATHAHDGVAHVVGLSMGGFVALDLARRFPQRCRSAFATGAAPFAGAFAWMAARPRVVFALMGALERVPDAVYWWVAGRSGMRRFEALRREMAGNRRWEVVSAVYASILSDVGWDEVAAIDAVRVLDVAAGRQDDVEAARRVGRVWRETGARERLGSRAVVVRGAVHAWDLQLPELFAEGIRAWVEGRDLPERFEDLE